MSRCTRCKRDATPPFRLCSECREDRAWYAARRRAADREARAVADLAELSARLERDEIDAA